MPAAPPRPASEAPECPPGSRVGAPDFVGVGAQRCGTTWWYGLIADHPGVWQSPDGAKELHFFDRFAIDPVPNTVAADYAARFPRPPGLLAGEWTPRYMLDFWAPRLLARCAPRAKLLVCLRDPVERYRSGMALERAKGRSRVHPLAASSHQMRSLYHLQVRGLLAHFPREQILVLQHEACVEDPARELRRTYAFLGLDPEEHRPASLAAPANASDPAAKPSLDRDERDDLAALLLEDVRGLAADFPEIDLDRWPAFSALAGAAA